MRRAKGCPRTLFGGRAPGIRCCWWYPACASSPYNAGLRRYLWCQTLPGGDARFRGGFAIYDAPEPWGPWTTVAYTEEWDVGPGESSGFPTKWMSSDGRTVHLVFSGDDCFSVRKATFVLHGSAARESIGSQSSVHPKRRR